MNDANECFEVERRRYVFDGKFSGLYEVELFNSTAGHVFASHVGKAGVIQIGILGDKSPLEIFQEYYPAATLIASV